MKRHVELVQMPASREPRSLLAVDRAVSELRRGRMIGIRGHEGRAVLMMVAEAVTNAGLSLLSTTACAEPVLAVTGRRAVVLGLAEPDSPVNLINGPNSQPLTADQIGDLADPLSNADGEEMRDLIGSVRVDDQSFLPRNSLELN